MPTLLDNVLETHDGPEPRVLTEDVQAILQRKVKPGDEEGNGAAVGLIAERAGCSTRTVYRVLNPDEAKVTISLDLADRLCLAAGTHIAHNCRLVWPSGKVTAYPDLDVTLPDNLA
jgi:arginine/ornithine N-succinyltransferase beta subunit